MAGWRFYGRVEEVGHLIGHLRAKPGFYASCIHGRRGIGKTELMAEVARRCDGIPPVLIFELEPISRETEHRRNERLIEEALRCLPQERLEGFPPPDDRRFDLPHDRFADLLLELHRRGVTVALDEFHFAVEQSLEGPIKRMIDSLKRVNAEHVDGRLYVMGSHQQQILRMFDPDQLLHQRIYPTVTLKQWEAPTVLEMAEEQGLLEHHGRLLTLWTAFGGIPRNWHEFMDSPETRTLTDMGAWDSDSKWRVAFLKAYERLLTPGSSERTDSKAYIELAPPQRDILQWLAENHPNGVKWDRLDSAMRELNHDDIKEPFHILRRYLELVEGYGPFWKKGETPPRVRIIDNATLFQRGVYPDLFTPKPEDRDFDVEPRDEMDFRMQRLATMEGYALERLARSHFRAQEDISWAFTGAWRRTGKMEAGTVEIDVMALRGKLGESNSSFIMCGCKRNAKNHDYNALEKEFGIFQSEAIASDKENQWPKSPVEKVVISPSFTEEQREEAAAWGFRALDIADMALSGPGGP